MGEWERVIGELGELIGDTLQGKWGSFCRGIKSVYGVLPGDSVIIMAKGKVIRRHEKIIGRFK